IIAAALMVAPCGVADLDLLGVALRPLITPPSDDPRGRLAVAPAVAPLPLPTIFARFAEGAGRAGALAGCGAGGAGFLGCGLAISAGLGGVGAAGCGFGGAGSATSGAG